MDALQTIGLLTLLVICGVAGGFFWGLGFWYAKKVVARYRLKLEKIREAH